MRHLFLRSATTRVVLASCCLSSIGGAQASSGSLRISGVIDGPLSGGVPKAVELYAAESIPDLSDYGIGSANNGGGSDGEEFTLSGSVVEGEFLYVASETAGFESFFGFAPDFTHGSAVSINGDDAIELFFQGMVVDVFGDIDVDGTGQAWEYLDGWAYRVNGSGPDGDSFVLGDWLFSGPNALDGEGTNGTAATPFPLGSYLAESQPMESGCGEAAVAIYDVQGSSTQSPLLGTSVVVEGVVTGDFQSADANPLDLNGFFLQQQVGDDDPSTSDGVFVFDDPVGFDVQPGDLVRVTGNVTEFFGETQITASSVEVCGTANVSATPILLPVAGVVANADGELIADLEAFEGMLVEFPQTLTVSELFQLDRFGEIRLAQGGRFFQYTNRNPPDVAGFAAHLEDVARRNVVLDDGLSLQNPDPIRFPAPGLTTSHFVRMGDTVSDLVGVLRFSRGSGGSGDESYRLIPTVEPAFASENPRPAAPPEVEGRLRVASFNVLNFFNDLDDGSGACFPSFTSSDCRGADSADEFTRQFEKLLTALTDLDADIYGLIEIENDNPTGTASSLAQLVDGLNAMGTASCGTFDYVDPGQRVGDDAIAVALIYCTDRVELAPGTVPSVLTDADFASLGFAPGDAVFEGVATSRSPLAASFVELDTDEVLTVVVNHFKSKGASGLDDCGSSIDPALEPNCDQGDGQGFWNARRVLAAQALEVWLASNPTGSADPDVLVMGDINAYLEEDPVLELETAGYENLIRTHGAGGDAYSFVFDAQAGTLDHAFASASLAEQVTGVGEWHVNADEADALDYNLDFGRNPSLFDAALPFRNSDHDPLVIGVALSSAGCSCNHPAAIRGSATSEVLIGTSGDDILCGLGGSDLILGLGGNDCIDAGDGNDIVLGGSGADRIFGGGGTDVLSGDGGADRLNGGDGFDLLLGGSGADQCEAGEIVNSCSVL